MTGSEWVCLALGLVALALSFAIPWAELELEDLLERKAEMERERKR